MNAILLHGRPDKAQWEDPAFPSTSNYYWLPWAQKQLALIGIPTETPEVPNAWRTDYETWRQTFEQYSISDQTILIGHSCGAGFIVRWLTEHPEVRVHKVVLVAPWVDPAGDPGNEETVNFFDFVYDRNLAARIVKGITIINSSNDTNTIQTSVIKLTTEIDSIKLVALENRGHFFDDDCMQLPELIEEVVK